MNTQTQITMILIAALVACSSNTILADSYEKSNQGTSVSETVETTGAFGSNKAFTLEESEIPDTVIKNDLTDQSIKAVEIQYEQK